MLHPRHLPLSARLGGAFGLVAVLLLAVAVLGVSRVGAVKHDVNELGLRSVWVNRLGESAPPEAQPERELTDLSTLPETLDELVGE